MSPIQVTVQELLSIIKRRKRLLIFVPVVMLLVGIATSYLITPKYNSSISILVQKEQTLNPLVLHEMAVNLASEDRLQSFNEIVYSRETIEMLIDSLNLARDAQNNLERQELIEKTQNNIQTEFKGSDSFNITYYDTDPERAQTGTEILANHFIETRLSLENKRNEQTVDFFENKIKELEKAVKKRQQTLMELSKKRLEESPIDKTALNSRLQDIERQIETTEDRISELNRVLKLTGNISDSKLTDQDVEELYNLPLGEIPLGSELKNHLSTYEEFRQQYTKDYPGFEKVNRQIFNVLKRLPSAIQSEIEFKKIKLKDLNEQRNQVLNALEKNVVTTRMDEIKKADYGIYRDLYDKMKVKLEQARTTRDLGEKTTSQFVVIDPPYYPEEPTSPNRPLIIAGSFGIGLILAVIAIAGAEILDTVVRREEDIKDFETPVIAYVTDGAQ